MLYKYIRPCRSYPKSPCARRGARRRSGLSIDLVDFVGFDLGGLTFQLGQKIAAANSCNTPSSLSLVPSLLPSLSLSDSRCLGILGVSRGVFHASPTMPADRQSAKLSLVNCLCWMYPSMEEHTERAGQSPPRATRIRAKTDKATYL